MVAFHLQNNRHALHSCLLVSRAWSQAAVEFLYKAEHMMNDFDFQNLSTLSFASSSLSVETILKADELGDPLRSRYRPILSSLDPGTPGALGTPGTPNGMMIDHSGPDDPYRICLSPDMVTQLLLKRTLDASLLHDVSCTYDYISYLNKISCPVSPHVSLSLLYEKQHTLSLSLSLSLPPFLFHFPSLHSFAPRCHRLFSWTIGPSDHQTIEPSNHPSNQRTKERTMNDFFSLCPLPPLFFCLFVSLCLSLSHTLTHTSITSITSPSPPLSNINLLNCRHPFPSLPFPFRGTDSTFLTWRICFSSFLFAMLYYHSGSWD